MDDRSRIEVNVAICNIKRISNSWVHNTYTRITLINGQVGRAEEVQSWKAYITFGISTLFHKPYLYIVGDQTEANEETSNKIIEMVRNNKIPVFIDLI